MRTVALLPGVDWRIWNVVLAACGADANRPV
jgi:hypothetical protein